MMATSEPDDLEALGAYVDAAAALHGVTIAPEWHAAVIDNLSAIRRAARLVEAFPLDDDAEPAPSFTP